MASVFTSKGARQAEADWRTSIRHYSGQELLEIFPQIKKDLPAILAEQKQTYDQKRVGVKKILSDIPKDQYYEFNRWLRRWALTQNLIPQLIKINNQIQRTEELIKVAMGYPPRKQLSQDDFTRASEASLVEIAKQHIKVEKCGQNYRAICPFHPDKHPSLIIYPHTNSFHCFACKKGGNVITFTMLFFQLNFISAVKKLLNK